MRSQVICLAWANFQLGLARAELSQRQHELRTRYFLLSFLVAQKWVCLHFSRSRERQLSRAWLNFPIKLRAPLCQVGTHFRQLYASYDGSIYELQNLVLNCTSGRPVHHHMWPPTPLMSDTYVDCLPMCHCESEWLSKMDFDQCRAK